MTMADCNRTDARPYGRHKEFAMDAFPGCRRESCRGIQPCVGSGLFQIEATGSHREREHDVHCVYCLLCKLDVSSLRAYLLLWLLQRARRDTPCLEVPHPIQRDTPVAARHQEPQATMEAGAQLERCRICAEAAEEFGSCWRWQLEAPRRAVPSLAFPPVFDACHLWRFR